jgi:hypothetical protein
MKMRHALVIALALLSSSPLAYARQPPITEEERTIVQVYEAPGFTKDQLFTAARMWIAQNFKSAKAVIEYESKDEGAIIGNGSMAYPCGGGFKCLLTSEWRVPFTMKVETKDEKIRLTFTNIHLAWPASFRSGISSPAHDDLVYQRKDLDAIRPELLKFGDQIVGSVGQLKADDNW